MAGGCSEKVDVIIIFKERDSLDVTLRF